ncbi:hypothetical protein [Bifidobacterium longum]|uniref:hypothetical protein n=1 Tax=Bifidobacterium longum TaxID=216816 RepID=UPI0030F3B69E
MSDKKPFWEGKKSNDLYELGVKIDCASGATLTGTLMGKRLILSHNHWIEVFQNGNDDCVVPCAYVESIELLDDPEYERVDNIENVQVGDIVYNKEGNHYPVKSLYVYGTKSLPLVEAIEMEIAPFVIGPNSFAYALRRKPKLPDHDGLWWDKDNALWSVAISGMDDSKLVALLIGDPESPITRSVWLGLNSKHVTSQSPFRPAKVVEA